MSPSGPSPASLPWQERRRHPLRSVVPSVLKYRLDPATHRVVWHLFRPRQHILDICHNRWSIDTFKGRAVMICGRSFGSARERPYGSASTWRIASSIRHHRPSPPTTPHRAVRRHIKYLGKRGRQFWCDPNAKVHECTYGQKEIRRSVLTGPGRSAAANTSLGR